MESDRKDLKFPNKGDVYSALINFLMLILSRGMCQRQ